MINSISERGAYVARNAKRRVEAVKFGPHSNHMDRGKRGKIEQGGHPYAANPAFPAKPGEGSWPTEPGTDHLKSGDADIASYADLIASDQYATVVRRLATYLGHTPDRQEVASMGQRLFGMANQAMEIEAEHKEQLEKMAVDLVLSLPEFELAKQAVDSGELNIVAKLERSVHVETDVDPAQPDEYMQSQLDVPEIAAEFDAEKGKRRMVNSMIQGAAINKNFAFRLIDDELNQINPALSKLYGTIMATADFMYWALPEEMQRAMASGGEAAGKARLSFDDGVITVHADALNFPVLVQEIVKGLMEYAAYDPDEDPETRQYTLSQTDTQGDEVWDIQFGPAIWRQILRTVGQENQKSAVLVFQHLISLPAGEFNTVTNNILQGNAAGKQFLQKLFADIKAEDESQQPTED